MEAILGGFLIGLVGGVAWTWIPGRHKEEACEAECAAEEHAVEHEVPEKVEKNSKHKRKEAPAAEPVEA